MKQHYLIRPEQLNHAGNLFGGQILSWADETAYLTAVTEYPCCNFVTRALEATDFKAPAANGDIVEMSGKVVSTGETSCRVLVAAYNRTTGKDMFSTCFVMVNVTNGQKSPIKQANAHQNPTKCQN
jgi:acyl-CoA hydrolase